MKLSKKEKLAFMIVFFIGAVTVSITSLVIGGGFFALSNTLDMWYVALLSIPFLMISGYNARIAYQCLWNINYILKNNGGDDNVQ